MTLEIIIFIGLALYNIKLLYINIIYTTASVKPEPTTGCHSLSNLADFCGFPRVPEGLEDAGKFGMPLKVLKH
jgi:hypothetical protein